MPAMSGAAIAGMLTAALTSCAALEGYAANGELLAGAATSAAIAVALVAHQRSKPWPWWVAAGVLAGCSISLKQSGIDASIAIGGWLMVGLLAAATRRRSALRLAGFAGGLAIPIMAIVALMSNFAKITSWWREIDWRAMAAYALGGIPGAALGARTMLSLPPRVVDIALGCFFLVMIPGRRWLAARHYRIRAWTLVPAGLAIGFLMGEGTAWRANRRRRRAFFWLGIAWGALFLLRLSVQLPLYLTDQVTMLGTLKLVMGLPLFAPMVAVTWLVVRALYRRAD